MRTVLVPHWKVCTRRALIGLAAWGAVACRLTEPLPSDATVFLPPAIYTRWWSMTEACSGASGDLSAVTWLRAPGSVVLLDGRAVGGYWSSPHNTIVLADEALDDGAVVRHEMLHALIGAAAGAHPRAAFLDACASVVVCGDDCVTDAGPWHAPQPYVVMPPDSLDLDSEARLLPRESDGQRWVTLLVTVRNPRGVAILVPAPSETSTQREFGFDVRGPVGGRSEEDIADDSSRMYFRPYETKTRLYEFRVASELTSSHIVPGLNLMRGGFARRWTAYDTVDVSP
jgi:hypothetical protein